MIRFLRTFSWLRWRLMANSLRGGERRDTIERVSRVVALIGPAILLMVMISSVLGAATLGFIGGWFTVGRPIQWDDAVRDMLRVLLLAESILIVLVPMFIGVRGGGNRFTRLLLLPVSRAKLHFVEVVSGLADPWMAFVLPGLLAYGVALIAAASMHSEDWLRDFMFVGVMAIIAGLAFAFVMIALNSLVSFLISWLVRDRRRSELFVLLFILAITAASIVPLLMTDVRDGRTVSGVQVTRATLRKPTSALGDLPAWAAYMPSELYNAVVRQTRMGSTQHAWSSLAILAAEGALFYWLSFLVHRRLLESVESGRAHRKGRLPGEGPVVRVPGFWPGTSAVAIAQAYTALRTVRGRLVVMLPGPLVAMFAFLFRRMPGVGSFEQMIATHGYVTFGAGMVFGLYAAQALTMNQYGSDRSGLTMQFLQPIRDVDLVRGKTAGCAIVFGAGAMITLACALVVAPGGSPWLWLATLFGGAATFLAISPVAAWMSALFPIASDLSKTGTGGNPHAFAMIVGMFITGAALLPAALILAFVPESYAPLWMGLWAVVAAAVALPLLTLVAKTIRARRENLVLVAQSR